MIIWLLTASVFVLLMLPGLHGFLFSNKSSRLFDFISELRRSPDFRTQRNKAAEYFSAAFHKCFTLSSSRGNTMRGYYYPCGEGPSGKIVFMAHGLRSDHLDACGMYYRYYHSRGWDVFCCDNAGTGRHGRYTGYSTVEAEDHLLWLSFLTEHFGQDIKLVLHGFSMGAAALLRLSPDCPEQTRFIVSDSAFTDAESLLKGKLGPLYRPICFINRHAAGYDMKDTDLRQAVKRSRVPILFIHGVKDSLVPAAMAEELYSLCPKEKDCFLSQSAGHVESWHRDEEEYRARLDAFMEKYTA